MNPLATAVISICMSVAAQFLLKLGMSSENVKIAMEQPWSLSRVGTLVTEPYLLIGFATYGISAIIWLAVLSKYDVSKAYPLVGLGFALSAFVGVAMGEHVSLYRLSGIALICGGVWVIAQS